MKATALTAASAAAINEWLNRENNTMSELCETTVSNRQSILIINAIIAFVALVGIEAGLASTLIRIGWFGYSVNLCKKGGLR
jgi:hypothetical protein